jgi:diadenosine tetraphosphate (Ap4A) HIT family hydrolase
MPEYPRIPFDLDAYAKKVVSAPCFICRVARGEDDEHEVIVRDDRYVAFFNKFPTLIGHALVAPVEHREGVVQDYTEVEYLDLQRFIYRLGRAMVEVLPTERLYVLSIGSQQGNRHLHWHVASMPPGVPYLEQQFEALQIETNGYLDIPRADLARLASELRRAMGPIAG